MSSLLLSWLGLVALGEVQVRVLRAVCLGWRRPRRREIDGSAAGLYALGKAADRADDGHFTTSAIWWRLRRGLISAGESPEQPRRAD
jgi:hypothetical protein